MLSIVLYLFVMYVVCVACCIKCYIVSINTLLLYDCLVLYVISKQMFLLLFVLFSMLPILWSLYNVCVYNFLNTFLLYHFSTRKSGVETVEISNHYITTQKQSPHLIQLVLSLYIINKDKIHIKYLVFLLFTFLLLFHCTSC